MVAERIYHAAIYIRLSKEDGGASESNSVSNQRELIRSFLESRPEIYICSERIDDGFSGVSFDRPSMNAMLDDIREGRIDCVIVKDLSRFGRNYIEAGRYIEQIFPCLGVRFIAINDGFDSGGVQSQADGMMIPFMNLINDAYSRDISVKVRSQISARYKRGDYIGAFPVYGYCRSAEDKYRLEPDPYPAGIIREMVQWKLEGFSHKKIADRLNAGGVLSPLEYKRSLGCSFYTPFQSGKMAKWSAGSVGRILKNEIYTGTMVQGKESSPNYKIKKKFRKLPSQWAVVEDTHKAIISKEEFRVINRLMSADTRTSPSGDTLYLFAGLLWCGHCGRSMVRRPVLSGGKTYIYYMCRTRKADSAKCPNRDRIRESKLIEETVRRLQEKTGLSVLTRSVLVKWVEKIVIMDKHNIQINLNDEMGEIHVQNEPK